MRGSFKYKGGTYMKDIEKNLFAELDKDIIKSASKKDKKEKKKKKLNKSDPFGYNFDPDEFDKKKKKKNKKSEQDDSSKKDKKKKKDKSDLGFCNTEKKKALSDSKFSKKLLGSIKSSELKEAFKKQKVLIDNKKFWTKD